MTALRSIVFNAAFFAWTLLTQIAFLPVLALPRQATYAVGRFWVAGVLRLLKLLCGLKHEIRGLENLPRSACVIAVKHQSAWDVLIFSQFLDDPSYVIKRELMFVPPFGWYLAKIGCVPIDRAGGASALRRMLRKARAVLAAGRPLVIYPEGTRTAPGERRPYHPGVTALYTHLNATVVPVALNSGFYWGRRSFVKWPGRITLQLLPPIEPGLPRQRFLAELQRSIEDASERLAEEARDYRRRHAGQNRRVASCG